MFEELESVTDHIASISNRVKQEFNIQLEELLQFKNDCQKVSLNQKSEACIEFMTYQDIISA